MLNFQNQLIEYQFEGIVDNVKCWNATHFVQCIQSYANLSSIAHIMAIDINKNECEYVLCQLFRICSERLPDFKTIWEVKKEKNF